MEKLTKKLIFFVFLFAWMQTWGMPMTLLSISPHTQDMYSSPLPYSGVIEQAEKLPATTCEKVAARSQVSLYAQRPSQIESPLETSFKDIDDQSFLFYILVFLYSVSTILIFIRVSKLFPTVKN